MANSSEKDIQFKVVEKFIPDLESILYVTSHSSIWEYDQGSSQWHPLPFEGCCYLLKRTSSPWFKLFILNKKKRDHFEQDINKEMIVKMNEKMVQYEIKGD